MFCFHLSAEIAAFKGLQMTRRKQSMLLAATFLILFGVNSNSQDRTVDIRGVKLRMPFNDINLQSCRKEIYSQSQYIICDFPDGARMHIHNTGPILNVVKEITYQFNIDSKLAPESTLGKALLEKYGRPTQMTESGWVWDVYPRIGYEEGILLQLTCTATACNMFAKDGIIAKQEREIGDQRKRSTNQPPRF